MVFKVNTHDHRNGKGGFEGVFFPLKGLTDREFKSFEEARSAVEKRYQHWIILDKDNPVVYRDPKAARYISIYETFV